MFLIPFISIAQWYDKNWMSIYVDSISGTNLRNGQILSFITSPPSIIPVKRPYFNVNDLCTISDSSGKMILHTNGGNIYDANSYDIISNGDGLNPGYWLDHYQNRYYNSHLGIFCIPYGNGGFNFFHRSKKDSVDLIRNKLRLSNVKKNNSNKYEVISKNKILLSENFLQFHNAIKHANGKDWWILEPYSKKISNRNFIDSLFIESILLKNDSIMIKNNQVTLNQYADNSQSCISPNGKYRASTCIIYYQDTLPPFNNTFERTFVTLNDFNRCTGQLSNPRYIDFPAFEIPRDEVFGVAFSPNSRFLYVSTGYVIYQVDMNDPVPGLKLDTVAVYDGFLDKDFDPLGMHSFFGWMQLGPDGKIYIPSTSYNSYIAKPNKKGIACTVVQHGLKLPTISEVINLHPNYRLGPIDGSPCDTLGVDNRPLADFWWFCDSTKRNTMEFSDNSFYEPATWLWNFGDGTTSRDTSPYHTYSTGGTYKVCLITCNKYSCDTVCKNVPVCNTVATDNITDEDIKVDVFPNPTTGLVQFDYKIGTPIGTLEIFDILGKTLKKIGLQKEGKLIISLEDMTNGVYIYKLTSNDGKFSEGKIIKVE